MPKNREFAYLTLDAHHVQPLEDGGIDYPSNLLSVCLNCHRALHAGQYEIFAIGKSIKCRATISDELLDRTIKEWHNLSFGRET